MGGQQLADHLGGNVRLVPDDDERLVASGETGHGIEPNDQGGDVDIVTRARGGEVEIRVVNTVGLPSRAQGHGLALRNVRQRLRLMHDVAARLEAGPGEGRFVVRIVMPR